MMCELRNFIPFQRLGVSAGFVVILLLLSQLLAAGRTLAAVNTAVQLNEQEVYSQLNSGKRVLQDKNYVKPEQPTVYLTFDDGPSEHTGAVLDILRAEKVAGTFFMLGEQVNSRPELVRRALAEGHAIGNHTYNHRYKELYSSAEPFWQQVQQTEQALHDAAGIRTSLLRAPGGTYRHFDAFYFYYMDQAGYEVHDWSIDSGDSKRVGVPANEILQTVKKGPLGHQVIVLMHDGTGHAETVKALPGIISWFKTKGYAFAALSPQVKPIHFSLSTPKWPQSVNIAEHQRMLKQTGEYRLALQGGRDRVAMEDRSGQEEVKSVVRTTMNRDPLYGHTSLEPGTSQLNAMVSVGTGMYQSPLYAHSRLESELGASGVAASVGTPMNWASVDGRRTREEPKSGRLAMPLSVGAETKPVHERAAMEPGSERFEMGASAWQQQAASLPRHIAAGSGDTHSIHLGKYRGTEDDHLVPLRALLEGSGGRVEWHSADRTAAALLGFTSVEYDFSHYEMRLHQRGKKTTYHLPHMQLIDGTVYVPLRSTATMLGLHIHIAL
ncbi:polysaccharide deacetylase [Paenibacillus xerothermodurans]|uniref:NodB homology domain-containing protein n=1 Tax=Paenibacillus xerothermodurans TaxID=1977292 RepID=A0A2W1N8D3_PAEXE|nr:polysaccharide deacetylase [Paenibacillus xerothermodurans]PZE20839.1 hypothetical protein CBW46_011855 [Paenibacillus xerothermodurans]